MAENIHEYMKNKKDITLVVLAGSGHLINHDGIPSRVYRRNALPYRLLLNGFNTGKVGDIVLSNTTKSKFIKAKKLGVYLKSDTKLIVKSVKINSISHKIGLKRDDLILEVNGYEVSKLSDLKRVLYLLDSFDNLDVKVLRAGNIEIIKIQ